MSNLRFTTPAALYTRVARPCAPCPRHAFTGPRDHSYVRPPAPPANRVETPEPKPRRKVEPMSNTRRDRIYREQARGRLTPRQLRQLARMYRRGSK